MSSPEIVSFCFTDLPETLGLSDQTWFQFLLMEERQRLSQRENAGTKLGETLRVRCGAEIRFGQQTSRRCRRVWLSSEWEGSVLWRRKQPREAHVREPLRKLLLWIWLSFCSPQLVAALGVLCRDGLLQFRLRHEQILTICNILEKNFCEVTIFFSGYTK